MSVLFPYEISASDISHIQLQYYAGIRPIPYGIITILYFSKCMNQWVAIEVNRFHKISTVWSVRTNAGSNAAVYIGIHVFKENESPLFVEIRASDGKERERESAMPRLSWPYAWTCPPALPITTDVCDQLLDITLQTPFPIYHFQYLATDVSIPDTIIRVRDIIDSDVCVRPTPTSTPTPTTNVNHICKSDGIADAPMLVDGQIELFRVRAGTECDTFYLYTRKDKELVYYAPMYIPNLEQSLIWNAIFRSVQRPFTYDWIEKCEKEKRHANQPGRKCTVDNYRRIDTDMVKTVKCQYHAKFGHWIPLEHVPGPCRIKDIASFI